MVKRFMIGFFLGIGLMYYYLHHGEDVISGAGSWAERSATNYRGDRAHEAAREVLGDKK